ncbi:MAG: hypothetical protein R3F38_01015 [Gammaproteobacteria bacterium]
MLILTLAERTRTATSRMCESEPGHCLLSNETRNLIDARELHR